MLNVFVVERIGVRLVSICGRVTKHHYIPAMLHVRDKSAKLDLLRSWSGDRVSVARAGRASLLCARYRVGDRTNRFRFGMLNARADGATRDQYCTEGSACPAARA